LKVDKNSRILDLAIHDYSHTNAKASLVLDKKSKNYITEITIKGIYLKLTGRFLQKNPWYLPDYKAQFTIYVNDLDINVILEFTKELIVVPSRSKFKYLS